MINKAANADNSQSVQCDVSFGHKSSSPSGLFAFQQRQLCSINILQSTVVDFYSLVIRA